ncbi:MAG: hypothetical protein GY882_01815 [Actinomycetia bacterium]|nr:hypothetical protein [Actinomycetes bacterium]MCP4844907.1 hypothetical protein [Actinomycetes bacterium]
MNANRSYVSNPAAGYAITVYLPVGLHVVWDGSDGERYDLTEMITSLVCRGIDARIRDAVDGDTSHKSDDELVGGLGLVMDPEVSDASVADVAGEVVALVASLRLDQVELLRAEDLVALAADGVREALVDELSDTSPAELP